MKGRLLWRQARSSLGTSLVLVIIVAVAAAVFTTWPRLERDTFAGEISHQIATTPPTLRALTATSEGIPVTSADQWTGWDQQIEELIAGAGPELAAGTAAPRTSLTTERQVMTPEHGKPQDLWQVSAQIRVDPQIEDYITVTEGTTPAPADWPSEPEALFEAIAGGSLEPAEVMLSEQSAERVGLAVGDTFDVTLYEGTLPFRVAGVFTGNDPEADQWQFQLNTLSPRIDNDPDLGLSATAIGYLNPESTGWIGELNGLAPETEVWVPIQPSATDAVALADQLRMLTAAGHQLSVPDGSMPMEFSAGLTEVLDRAIDRWQGTAAVLAMVAAGPIGVVLAILALATRLVVARREITLALVHARGASPLQLRGILAAEGAVLGLPAAAIGAAAATLAVPGPTAAADYTWALLAGLTPAAFLAASTLPNLRARRSDLALRSASRWRWVAEAAAVALTAAALYLVLTRGVRDQGGTDPIATALPLLLAVTVCVLAVRLLPLPLRALHAAARRGRGLSAFLGSARTIREGGLAMVPLFALVVGTAVAVFATTMIATLTQGTDAGARAEVGADVRLTGPTFSEDDLAAIGRIDGVAATTAVAPAPSIPLYQDGSYVRVNVYGVQSSTQGEVQTDVPGAVVLPAEFDQSDDGSVPVLTSTGLEIDADADPFLSFREQVPITVVGQDDAAPALAETATWILADLDLLREHSGMNLLPRTVLVDVAADADVAQVTGELTDWMDGTGEVLSPAQNTAEFAASPASSSMQAGFVVALVLCLLLAVTAIAMSLVLAAPTRGRLLAVLRTLGAPARTSRRLVAWEVTPVVVTAMIAGTLVGLALPYLVVAGIDLRPFTGAESQPSVHYDPVLLAGVLVGFAVVLAGCLWLATVVARRLSLSVLRIGEAS